MSSTSGRKDEHLVAVLRGGVTSSVTTGFERWRPRHRALPGIDLGDVRTEIDVFGRSVRAPLLVSCMTGGSSAGADVNHNLAIAAEHHGIALGLGSMRAALEDPALLATFAVRDLAPSVPLLANTGVVGIEPERVAEACEQLQVDALVVHLNPLQEALQVDGGAHFGSALDTIAGLVEVADRPVVVKEVGFGLDPSDVAALFAVGCAGVDVAGAGGTNWALVEGARPQGRTDVAAAFARWGTPTAEALVQAVAVRDRVAPSALVVASGGISNGVDALVALCLGASLVGVGGALIPAATESADAASARIATIVEQLRLASFAVGAPTVADLDRSRLVDLRSPPFASPAFPEVSDDEASHEGDAHPDQRAGSVGHHVGELGVAADRRRR